MIPLFDNRSSQGPVVRRNIRGWMLTVVCLAAWFAAPSVGWPAEFTEDPADAEACRGQLNKIFEVIQNYKKDHDRLPNWLSDLYPNYLDNPQIFICPFVKRKGDFQSWRSGFRSEVFGDPTLPVSYAYEFCVEEYPLWGGHSSTVREFKERQMKLLGNDIPILRCLAHRPYLNLSLGGDFFISDFEWEYNFTNRVTFDQLLPDSLFSDEEHTRVTQILPRDPNTPRQLVDLSDYYNVSLKTPWEWRNPVGRDLKSLPEGIVQFPKVGRQFDVRGLIQVRGLTLFAPYAEKVEGIKVQGKAQAIHFLLGTLYSEAMGAKIGSFAINYRDRPAVVLPIIYGTNVKDLYYEPRREEEGDAVVAWEGVNEAALASGQRIRLFHMEWPNPHPKREIQSISLIAHGALSSPFLVAITLEEEGP